MTHSESLKIEKEDRIKVYMTVRGEKQYAIVDNPRGFLEKVNEIEEKKAFKTKILEN